MLNDNPLEPDESDESERLLRYIALAWYPSYLEELRMRHADTPAPPITTLKSLMDGTLDDATADKLRERMLIDRRLADQYLALDAARRTELPPGLPRHAVPSAIGSMVLSLAAAVQSLRPKGLDLDEVAQAVDKYLPGSAAVLRAAEQLDADEESPDDGTTIKALASGYWDPDTQTLEPHDARHRPGRVAAVMIDVREFALLLEHHHRWRRYGRSSTEE